MAEDVAHAGLAFQALVRLIRAAIDAGRTDDVIDVHEAWLRDLQMWSRHADGASNGLGELEETERQLRIGLGFWTIRAGHRSSETAASIFRYFASTFGSPADVLRAVGAAVRRSIESDEWLEWADTPRFGGGYSPAVDLGLLQSGLAMCTLLILDGSDSTLPGMEWLPVRLDAATSIVRDFSTPSWEWLFGTVKNLDEALSNLSEALAKGAREQRALETEQIRQAPISQALKTDLETRLQSKWEEYSIVRTLFDRSDQVQTEAVGGPESTLRLVRANLLRSSLIEGSAGDSNEFIATEVSRSLARQELEVLVSRAGNAVLSENSNDALTARLEAALARVGTALVGALAILMPVNPLVEVEFGLRQALGPGQPDSLLFGAAGVGHWFRGMLHETPVIQYPAVPRDRVVVLGRDWGRYVEWVPGGSALRIDLVEVEGVPPGANEPQLQLSVARQSDIEVTDETRATAFRIDDLELRFA